MDEGVHQSATHNIKKLQMIKMNNWEMVKEMMVCHMVEYLHIF